MDKSETESKEMPEKLATEAQIKLIKELYEETSYNRPYFYKDLPELARTTANKHIQFLKDLKSMEYQQRKNHETGVQFDKIGFGLVYKLVYKHYQGLGLALKPTADEFSDTLNTEYKLFKQCQEACRQFVADGGLK